MTHHDLDALTIKPGDTVTYRGIQFEVIEGKCSDCHLTRRDDCEAHVRYFCESSKQQFVKIERKES